MKTIHLRPSPTGAGRALSRVYFEVDEDRDLLTLFVEDHNPVANLQLNVFLREVGGWQRGGQFIGSAELVARLARDLYGERRSRELEDRPGQEHHEMELEIRNAFHDFDRLLEDATEPHVAAIRGGPAWSRLKRAVERT